MTASPNLDVHKEAARDEKTVASISVSSAAGAAAEQSTRPRARSDGGSDLRCPAAGGNEALDANAGMSSTGTRAGAPAGPLPQLPEAPGLQLLVLHQGLRQAQPAGETQPNPHRSEARPGSSSRAVIRASEDL